MARLTTILMSVSALALAATLTACGDGADAETTDSSSSPEASPRSESTPEPDVSPLEGGWVNHITPEEAAQYLKDAGLAKWTEEFLKGEEIMGEVTAVYTFAGDTFSVAYYEPDGTWHVGWKGPMVVDGNQVVLDDDFSDSVDTYTWTIKGDQLTFTEGHHVTENLDGIPLEVYDAGYLTEPLKRTDCPMNVGENC